jgi:hypothetical protein
MCKCGVAGKSCFSIKSKWQMAGSHQVQESKSLESLRVSQLLFDDEDDDRDQATSTATSVDKLQLEAQHY